MCFIKLLCLASAVLLYAGFTSQSSTDVPPAKHRLNYQGSLVDVEGNSYDIENLSIQGLLRGIKFYVKPLNASVDPATNITFIDLDELSSIEPAHANPRDGILFFKNRPYIELTLTLADKKTTHTYIIETTRKILCDMVTAAGPLEKEVAFESLKKLTITGKSERLITQPRMISTQQCKENKEQLRDLQEQVAIIDDPVQKGIIQRAIDGLTRTISTWCN